MADYLTGIGTALGGAASIGSGISNLIFGRRDRDYRKRIQQNIFDREDSAVRRRAIDMEAAGLSKTLAAGGGASAGAAVNTTPPSLQGIGEGIKDIASAPEKALAIKQQRESIETTKNQNKLLMAQANKVEKETELIGGKKNLQDIDLMYAEAFNERKLNIMASDVEIKKTQEEIAKLDQRSKQLGLTAQELNLLIAELNRKKATQSLAIGEKEIIAKQLYIELADEQLKENTYNREWFQDDKQLPTKGLQNPLNTATGSIMQGLSGLWERLRGKTE